MPRTAVIEDRVINNSNTNNDRQNYHKYPSASLSCLDDAGGSGRVSKATSAHSHLPPTPPKPSNTIIILGTWDYDDASC